MTSSSSITEYRGRLSILERPRSFRIEPDGLSVAEEGAPARIVRWSDIASVRLRFAPTRVQRRRFECAVTSRDGARLVVGNERYVRPLVFEDASGEYAAFCRELCRRLADVSGVRFESGIPAARYWIELGLLGAVFALLSIVLVTIAPGGMPVKAVVQLVLLACYVPTLVAWIRRNRPGTFDPREVSAQILP